MLLAPFSPRVPLARAVLPVRVPWRAGAWPDARPPEPRSPRSPLQLDVQCSWRPQLARGGFFRVKAEAASQAEHTQYHTVTAEQFHQFRTGFAKGDVELRR